MYWKVEEYKDVDDNNCILYNYYDFVDAVSSLKPYYNGFTKTFVFPCTKQLVVKAVVFATQEDFLEWYHENKNL